MKPTVSKRRDARLARAKSCGYLIGSMREPACNTFWRWCRSQRRPCVLVTMSRRYAAGAVDFEPTVRLDADPDIGLTEQELSELGARMAHAFFDAYAAPHGRLFGACEGSVAVTIDGIPAARAEALGEMLVEAAMATDAADGAITITCEEFFFGGDPHYTRAPGTLPLRPAA